MIRVYPPGRSAYLGAISLYSLYEICLLCSMPMTVRREFRSPALPMVIAFSTIGRTSLALASVVFTRPCSSTEQARFASICRRWLGWIPNRLPFLWCLTLLSS